MIVSELPKLSDLIDGEYDFGNCTFLFFNENDHEEKMQEGTVSECQEYFMNLSDGKIYSQNSFSMIRVFRIWNSEEGCWEEPSQRKKGSIGELAFGTIFLASHPVHGKVRCVRGGGISFSMDGRSTAFYVDDEAWQLLEVKQCATSA